MSQVVNIKVRYYCNTYIAAGGGKQASCTMSPHEAAERLAQKLAGDRIWKL